MGLTTIMLLVASVCCWTLGPARSRCRRPLRHLCSTGEDVFRRLLAGPLSIEPWADMVSQHIASRLAMTNAAARAFVWRRLAVIGTAWLLLVSAGLTAVCADAFHRCIVGRLAVLRHLGI